MPSLAPFLFSPVDLHTVTISGNLWTRTTEVCKVIGNGEKLKIAAIIKQSCSKKKFIYKYQMSIVHTVNTPVGWPKDSQKCVLYLDEVFMKYLEWNAKSKRLQQTRLQYVVFLCLAAAHKKDVGRTLLSNSRLLQPGISYVVWEYKSPRKNDMQTVAVTHLIENINVSRMLKVFKKASFSPKKWFKVCFPNLIEKSECEDANEIHAWNNE